MCQWVCPWVPAAPPQQGAPSARQSPLEPWAASRFTTFSSVSVLLLPLDCCPITICGGETTTPTLERTNRVAGGGGHVTLPDWIAARSGGIPPHKHADTHTLGHLATL